MPENIEDTYTFFNRELEDQIKTEADININNQHA